MSLHCRSYPLVLSHYPLLQFFSAAVLVTELMEHDELLLAKSVTVLPLFLGPSRQVSTGIPRAVKAAEENGVSCRIAKHIGAGEEGEAWPSC